MRSNISNNEENSNPVEIVVMFFYFQVDFCFAFKFIHKWNLKHDSFQNGFLDLLIEKANLHNLSQLVLLWNSKLMDFAHNTHNCRRDYFAAFYITLECELPQESQAGQIRVSMKVNFLGYFAE